MAIGVVIADDDLLVREGILRILEPSDEVELLAACGDRDDLLRAIERHSPDVVVTDIRMPPALADEGLQVATACAREHPEMGVVVLSAHAEVATRSRCWRTARRAGLPAEGTPAEPRQLAGAIQEVAKGGSIIDPRWSRPWWATACGPQVAAPGADAP